MISREKRERVLLSNMIGIKRSLARKGAVIMKEEEVCGELLKFIDASSLRSESENNKYPSA